MLFTASTQTSAGNADGDVLLRKIGESFALASSAPAGRNYGEAIAAIRTRRDTLLDAADVEEQERLSNALNQPLATLYSFVGRHDLAQQLSFRVPPRVALETGRTYRAVPALDWILDQLDQQRVVMVNEAHHVAQHRLLTQHLLEHLYQAGFRYLAVEALTADEGIDARGYVRIRGLSYLNEPTYADMLRVAHGLGFTLIAYDIEHSEQREQTAAAEIIRQSFAVDEGARVLVHAGYAHINKRSRWLAGELQQRLSIEPLSINQSDLLPGQLPANAAEDLLSGHNDAPLVLLDEHGDAWSARPEHNDVTILWPETPYMGQRPSWHLGAHETLELDARWCQGSYPCLVEVTRTDEPQAVPFDRILVDATEQTWAIRVPSEPYEIASFSANGEPLRRIESP